jgi:hypothetical protein
MAATLPDEVLLAQKNGYRNWLQPQGYSTTQFIVSPEEHHEKWTPVCVSETRLNLNLLYSWLFQASSKRYGSTCESWHFIIIIISSSSSSIVIVIIIIIIIIIIIMGHAVA